MKKNFLLLALLALATIGFTACGGDDINDGGNDVPDNKTDVKLPEQPYKEDAVRLKFTQDNPVDYYIKDENGKTGYNVTELELTESGYYFVKLEKKRDMEAKATRAAEPDYFYLWGLYTKNGNGTYELAGFGSVTIRFNGGGSVSLTLTIVSSAEETGTVTVNVTVTPPNNNNSQENLNLCRSWDIVSTRVQIEGVSGFYQENGCDLNSILAYIKSLADVKDNLKANQVIEKIVFSDNGTFSLLYANENTDRAGWRWVSESAGTLAYDWEFGDMGYSFVDGTAQVILKPISEPSQLKLFGSTINKEGARKKVTITVNIK